ncbi:alpha/beta hydrolase [Actinopolymorpha rutila]|uniref:Pimeloyl-ACP methyl ester carboxylesterase n=1 Tax=Actinopolymorpha rutila TaxID=446787 RepID=A0A852Z988_9ACTN|nr:alpha/beta fold hydrolase [Actinopolymorpha rutila]NYH88903.1 pimeloyl-ACP methyl ester carboxylesterase [Actinopolymorpha rutila]
MPPSRRSLLSAGIGTLAAAAAGVGLVESRLVPGRTMMHTALGLTGEDGVVPAVAPGPMLSGTFTSAARAGTQVAWTVAYPPGSPTDAPLPVVLALHGRGGDHRAPFDELGLDRFMAADAADWRTPFALVSVDGGASTFWHRRRNGDDPQAMLLTELLPRLAQRGLRTDRIGLIGWSMGGFGALLFAAAQPDLVGAAVVVSPALWREYADVRPGAFDGPTDFAANNVFADQRPLAGLRLRVDCGRDDPFAAATREFVNGLTPPPAGGFQPGAHTVGYWRRMAPEQLRFLAWNL